MILHGCAWRSSKNKVLGPKTLKINSKSQIYSNNLKNNSTIHENICFPVVFLVRVTLGLFEMKSKAKAYYLFVGGSYLPGPCPLLLT